MSYRKYYPKKVFVEEDARSFPMTEKILARLKDIPVEIISDTRALIDRIKKAPDPVASGKQYLLLAHDRGRSFKPFPESENYLSCDYFTLHLAEGCDLECSYCILQTYLTNPLLTVYVNTEEMLENLSRTLDAHPDRFFRIGTGQLADSLSLDHITRFSEVLIPYFRGKKNAVLELKTKSTNIDALRTIHSDGKAIISWSVNAKRIQRLEEHKCASIEERIEAAGKLISETDHRVAFHFDPVIDFPGWEEEYGEVVSELLAGVDPDRIAWISLGCLRFMPDLKRIMQERFPKSSLPLAEWIRGMDGKMRYFKPRRVEIYRTLARRILEKAPHVTLYLSMESEEVWRHVFGGTHTRASVCQMLDRAGRNSGRVVPVH